MTRMFITPTIIYTKSHLLYYFSHTCMYQNLPIQYLESGSRLVEQSSLFSEKNIAAYICNKACVRGSPMVPLVGNICTIGTNLITNGTIGKEIGANGKNGNAIGAIGPMLPTNGTIGRTPNTRKICFTLHVFYGHGLGAHFFVLWNIVKIHMKFAFDYKWCVVNSIHEKNNI